MVNPLKEYIAAHRQDAVLYKTTKLIKNAGDDAFARAGAIDVIKIMLACINNEILAEAYTKMAAAICGVPVKLMAKTVKDAQEAEQKLATERQLKEGESGVPRWVDGNRLAQIGFDWRCDTTHPDNTGMYFRLAGEKGFMERMTNFVMTPIVQIISDKEDSKARITEITNGRATHVFALPSAAFITPDQFEKIIMDQGDYYLMGLQKGHLNKIKAYYLSQYPKGYELSNLGWQDEGFFAFSNVVYKNGIAPYDKYGITEVDDVKYLSMGASNLLSGLRKGTSSYKEDMYLHYDPAPLTFGEWSNLVKKVYGDKAMMGIAWCLLSVCKDIVIAKTSYCPVPYAYGAKQSGKTVFVQSFTNVFTKNLRPINLNQTSIFAMWEYVERFKNVLMAFNEFDENTLDDKITRAFKGMADNEGRRIGTGVKGKTKSQDVNCLPLILGQFLATMDDGSLLSRTTPEKFVEKNDYTEEEKKNFTLLKDYEHKGITGLLCNILQHRGAAEMNYAEVYAEVDNQLRSDFAAGGQQPKNRVIENYTVLLALVKIYQDRLELNFTYDEFYSYCKAQILNLNKLIGESDSLGDFWKIMQTLVNMGGTIEPGWDYKIEVHTEVKSMIADKTSKNAVSFDKPTRLLFLRFNDVYGFIAKEKRNQSGKVYINDSTVKAYLIDQPYYIGAQSNGNFKSKLQGKKTGTSSMVLNYDKLQAMFGINLEVEDDDHDTREKVTLEGFIKYEASLVNRLDTEKMRFLLLQDDSYVKEGGLKVEKYIETNCISVEQQDLIHRLKPGAKVKVSGMLAIDKKGDRVWRNMEVQDIEIILDVLTPEELQALTPRLTPTPPPQQFQIDLKDTDNEEPF